MGKLSVYADILIIINIIVDYFIIRIVQHFLQLSIKTWRILLASFFGGISSLYIFIPQSSLLFEILYRILVCLTLSIILCGFKSIKKTIFACILIFIVTCAYTGTMIALWFIIKPNGMVINNSIVYFDVSPTIIILFTVIFYIVFSLLNFLFKRTAKLSEKCFLKIGVMGREIEMKAIIDSGNSLEDPFSDSEIIIADEKQIKSLFGEDYYQNNELKNRYRKIPCGTVGGTGLLDAFRCDYAIANSENGMTKLNKPILAISKTDFNDDYSAIVNPRIFL